MRLPSDVFELRAHLPAEEYRRRVAEVVEEIESQASLKRQLLDLYAKGPGLLRSQGFPGPNWRDVLERPASAKPPL